MARFLYLIFIVLLGVSCSQRIPGRRVSVGFEHLDIDSCTLQLYHMITGKMVYKADLPGLKENCLIDSLDDDMYLLVISWPRIVESDTDESDVFELTKPIYISKQQDTVYTIFSPRTRDKAHFELKNGADSLFVRSNSSDGLLADEFWAVYNDFFDRKELLLDSLKQTYYSSANRSGLQSANDIHNKMDSIETTYFRDNKLDDDIIAKIQNNLSSPVSAYFLFYQLYHYREFEKYRAPFLQLRSGAASGKYYRMVKKQYNK